VYQKIGDKILRPISHQQQEQQRQQHLKDSLNWYIYVLVGYLINIGINAQSVDFETCIHFLKLAKHKDDFEDLMHHSFTEYDRKISKYEGLGDWSKSRKYHHLRALKGCYESASLQKPFEIKYFIDWLTSSKEYNSQQITEALNGLNKMATPPGPLVVEVQNLYETNAHSKSTDPATVIVPQPVLPPSDVVPSVVLPNPPNPPNPRPQRKTNEKALKQFQTDNPQILTSYTLASEAESPSERERFTADTYKLLLRTGIYPNLSTENPSNEFEVRDGSLPSHTYSMLLYYNKGEYGAVFPVFQRFNKNTKSLFEEQGVQVFYEVDQWKSEYLRIKEPAIVRMNKNNMTELVHKGILH
jgi:hypothetical protein